MGQAKDLSGIDLRLLPLGQRRELLAAAADQIWESICITDADIESPGPRIVYVNHGFEILTGWSENEVLGKTPRILQGPLTDRAVLNRLKKCLIDGQPFHGEAINYRKNGESYWLEWRISPIKDSDGLITHFIAFQRNITQVKEAQQRIEDFYSVLSHELRAPLASILGALKLMEDFQSNEPESKELLGIALSSTTRLTTLVDDLLELSKIESGQFELKLEKVSATTLVKTAADSLFSYRIEEKISIDIDALDVYVMADFKRIVQVLVNLISNAMKFSPANSSVLVSVSDSKNGAVRFSITDKGPGISLENQRKLFSKFQQLVAADGIQRPGTGLGLSTVKALVEQHSGHLGVSSSLGSGTTFWFELAAAT